ncbi:MULTISPECIES: BadF/BadG/BcrA/BcrD ATPase family protein [Myroides]|uniref:BadF/BadG/BcrA/BcrD ATPase family protein n=1 Tax=Myroides TaxID=76831 RepID=UPI0008F4FC2B|nr:MULTISPECIES: BadF/BadG/BcrA/BcrD ATPase family protein [Myroides]APA92963.1 N-acetylglucosamine kinase [Myroides sp. ZB35]MCS7474033.1 N-acetylglucosamine kinase [Myroides odoratimimus]MDM1064835.1 N-acetylglucosamine kinase [Myroides odoratimimus]WHT72405.1 BadF/BadG/BcrA/BcrD ATPase family protein [Myroides odoratimimus]WHU36988.1 BadF/BadG/BcrA/BcrD ATPase family protein [Myroides odoratimimus]
MKIIVDSGSTKADWIFFDQNNNVITSVTSLGLNPEVITLDEFFTRVNTVPDICKNKDEVKELYFYGSGCGSDRTKNIVKRFAEDYFANCKNINVHEDTYAAIYATVGKGEKGIVCINGTGSNVSYFDGNKVYQRIESLGFMAMDDCSGSALGRLMIKSFFLKMMPKELADLFKSKYDVDADVVKYNFYKKENPNAYMASFLPFLIEHKDKAFFQEMIREQISFFVNHYIKNNPEYTSVSVHFVGSVAYFLQDEFREVMAEHNIQVGKIIQKPLDGLIEYHK